LLDGFFCHLQNSLSYHIKSQALQIKLKLIHILVAYPGEGFIEEFYSKYKTREQFAGLLGHHQYLYDILYIQFVYELSKSVVLQLNVRNVAGEDELFKWQVYHLNKPFFSFECEVRSKFINTFEKHLRKELEKHEVIRTIIPIQK
jgi:hypothetical protein